MTARFSDNWESTDGLQAYCGLRFNGYGGQRRTSDGPRVFKMFFAVEMIIGESARIGQGTAPQSTARRFIFVIRLKIPSGSV
jgi:hypothetical protein